MNPAPVVAQAQSQPQKVGDEEQSGLGAQPGNQRNSLPRKLPWVSRFSS